MILFHVPARPSPRRGLSLALAFLLGTLAVPLLADPASGQIDLPLPAVLERPIQAGESHSFTFQLAEGQFFGAVVEQDGIDLVVEVFDPKGEKLLEMDGPDFWLWEEEVAVQAAAAGPYRLVVRPFRSYETGKYRMRLDGPHAPREGDSAHLEALRELAAAHRLIGVQGHEAELAEHLERARQIWQELGERRRQAEAAHQLVDALADLKRMDEARERYREAVGLWQELDLPAQRAFTLLQSWRPYESLFPRDETLGLLEEALSLGRQSGNRFVEAWALYTLGRFHQWQPRIAAGHLENALTIAREIRDPLLEMHSAYQLAFAYDDLAETQDAFGLYERALKLSRALHEAGVEANVLNTLGYLYFALGHSDKAVEHLEQAIELSRAGGGVARQAAALNNLALIYEKLDPEKARGLYETSLALAGGAGNRELQAFALVNLARLDLRAGDAAGALARGRLALPFAAGFSIAESQVRIGLGNAYRKAGDLESSRHELETALRLCREHEDRVRESLVLPGLARTEIQAGNLLKARDLLEAGIRTVESLRVEVAQEELRSRFLASRKDTYELYLNTLMALDREQPDRGWDAEALRASERARARSLLDILAQAGADVRGGADPALVERERRLLAEIEELEQRRLLSGDAAEIRAISVRLAALLDEHGAVEAALRASSPRYAALTQPEPLSLTEIQREVLDHRALLLEYALGEEKSFLWAVTPTSLTAYELPPRAKIEEVARRWYEALRVHPETDDGAKAAAMARQAAGELSEMLLRPAEALFHGQPLLIVKDGALHYLPFAALPVPSSLGEAKRVPMIAQHEIVMLPSASALAVLRRELAGRPAAPKTLAVFADPVFRPQAAVADSETAAISTHRGPILDTREGELDPRRLPRLGFSRREAEAIAVLVPEAQRFKATGFAASRAAVTSGELANYRLVHFATHGLINSHRPELSSLVLSLFNERGEPQNGFLRLHDIYNLKLQADLVVLSACQTALGEEIRGEGLVGLTRGFMYAGAARVVASLWSVDDRATSVLMERFYRHMITGRLSPAAALRQAQIEMSRQARWKDPYYWAAFSLQGEWK